MGDHYKAHDSSSSGETDIGACSGHKDREKTGSENGGVDAPDAQRALLRPHVTHPNEQFAAPENIRGQSDRALPISGDVSHEPPPSEEAAQVDVSHEPPPSEEAAQVDVSHEPPPSEEAAQVDVSHEPPPSEDAAQVDVSHEPPPSEEAAQVDVSHEPPPSEEAAQVDVSHEPPPSEGAAQVDDDTLDQPWWEQISSGKEQVERDIRARFAALGILLRVRADGKSFFELGKLLGVVFSATNITPVSDEDPEIGPLILEAEQNCGANKRGRQLQDCKGGRSRLSVRERLEDTKRCCKCMDDETEVITLPCGHCLLCKKCFHLYLDLCGRPVRCPGCNVEVKYHEFR